MEYLITILLAGAILAIFPGVGSYIKQLFRSLAGAGNDKRSDVFDNNFIEIKAFYLYEFSRLPCVNFISDVDTDKIHEWIMEGNAGTVLDVYQYRYYDWRNGKQEATKTIFKLQGRLMIELFSGQARILCDSNDCEYGTELTDNFVALKAGKKNAFEINIITVNNNYLELKQMDIKQTELEIGLYYNDDFKPIDELIRRRLEQDNDKGIILLHGLPGTGKTTYLRHLIGSLKKKVLFVSPAVAENLMNPEFIDLLIDNPNCVLVIEDAENIIRDRKYSSNGGVSNLLNISDGLLSDCLNVQIICTFNNALSTVDSALLRKGRLIAKYEFNKLDAVKAQKLSDHLGLKHTIDRSMTLAEITNPDDMNATQDNTQVLGFRREALMN